MDSAPGSVWSSWLCSLLLTVLLCGGGDQSEFEFVGSEPLDGSSVGQQWVPKQGQYGVSSEKG